MVETTSIKEVSFDMPNKIGKDSYIQMFLNLYQGMSNVVQNPNFEPARAYYMCHLIISMIPEQKKREEIRIELKKRYEELQRIKTEELKRPITDSERSAQLMQASVETVGRTVDYVDMHVGLSVDNKVALQIHIPKKKDENNKIIVNEESRGETNEYVIRDDVNE